MTLPSDFAAGALLVLLYASAIVVSVPVTVWMARLFSTRRDIRLAAVFVFGAGQLRFILDSPMPTVIESMNVTHVLISQSANDAPIVAFAEVCLRRSLEAMITKTNVPPSVPILLRTLSTVSAVQQLERTYDEIATRGALSPAVRNSWRFFIRSSGEELPSSGQTDSFTTSPLTALPLLPSIPPSESNVVAGLESSSFQYQRPVQYDFNLGRLVGGGRDDDADDAAARVESDESFTAPESAVLVHGKAWHFGIDGRPYYVVWAKASGRRKSGRHLIKCGLAHPTRVTIAWPASNGALSHDGILRMMRAWADTHPGDRRLIRDDADEKPHEPDGQPDENTGAVACFRG